MKPSELTDDVRLRPMLDAARQAVAFASSRVRSDLDTDAMLTLAVTRLLEILGEASKAVSKPLRTRNAQIPWRDLARTRDRLVRDYFDIKADILWETLTVDLPTLIPQLEALLPGH